MENRETMETVTGFIFLGSKITVNSEFSYKIRRCLLLERKAVTNLDSELKSKDITLPTKVHLFKAMVFPVVMYGCESWTVKKAEHQRIDAFKLWCLSAGTSRQYEQVSIAAARKPEKKELKVKNGVERTEMLFRQVSNFIE